MASADAIPRSVARRDFLAAGGGDFTTQATASFRARISASSLRNIISSVRSTACAHRFRVVRSFGDISRRFCITTDSALRAPYKDLKRCDPGGKRSHPHDEPGHVCQVSIRKQVSEPGRPPIFFQCSRCCTDETLGCGCASSRMIASMGEGTESIRIDPALPALWRWKRAGARLREFSPEYQV